MSHIPKCIEKLCKECVSQVMIIVVGRGVECCDGQHYTEMHSLYSIY